MHLSNFLITHCNDDNLSDRWFFSKLALATRNDDRLASLLTAPDFHVQTNAIHDWATRSYAISNQLDPYRLVVRWLHSAALRWSAFGGDSETLYALENTLADTYRGKFGQRIPSGWRTIFISFRALSAESFVDDLPMPLGHDLYMLTHEVLTRSDYLNVPYELSAHETMQMLSRIQSGQTLDNLIEDIDLECVLLLLHANRIPLTSARAIHSRAKAQINKSSQINNAALREHYHFLLLLTLIEGMLDEPYSA
jgi:hypothetical protein